MSVSIGDLAFAFGETLYMTLLSTLVAYAIGLPIGIGLIITDKNGLRPMRVLNAVLGIIVNILRSIPFLILLIAIMPFTRFITGTTIGSVATIVPLTVAAAPFVARMVESSLKEVDPGVVEAAQSRGASTWTIVWSVFLKEGKPSLIVGSAIALGTILGYSAMAGIVGGGGLGAIAINYGYYRGDSQTMLITVVLLVVIVQILQEVAMFIARTRDRRL
ncbi:MAG: methionine ABC transporter permease [Christensenellaceae bacterium]